MENPTTKISVTADDIAKGTREDCNFCPIALAVARELRARYVEVGNYRITADILTPVGWAEFRWETPRVAGEFVRMFDDGESVEPFEFDLGAPILSKENS